jgi:hypothetical protein
MAMKVPNMYPSAVNMYENVDVTLGNATTIPDTIMMDNVFLSSNSSTIQMTASAKKNIDKIPITQGKSKKVLNPLDGPRKKRPDFTFACVL